MEPVGGDWKMIQSSHKFEKTEAFAAQFLIPVPKNGETVLVYRVRSRYC